MQLGLFRSDYMVHLPNTKEPPSLRQVEFNTISSSFGALSERIAALHRYAYIKFLAGRGVNVVSRYLYASTKYFDSVPELRADSFPQNSTTAGLAEGLATAHRAYGVPE